MPRIMDSNCHQLRIWTLALCVFTVFLTGLSTASIAQTGNEDIVNLDLDGTSESKSITYARKEILNSVMRRAAKIKVIELIGEQKYNKNLSFLNTLILKQAAKFIPVATPSKLKRNSNGTYSMTVGLKISIGSLRSILQKNGMLYDRDGPARILPMIVWQDRVNSQSYSWWVAQEGSDKSFLLQLNRSFDQALFEAFSDKGFYLVRTLGSPLRYSVPSTYRSERLRTTDYMFFGDFYAGDIITKGEVRIEASRKLVGASVIKIKLVSLQAENGRTIAEIARSFETETGQFEMTVRNTLTNSLQEISKDLAVQVREAWEKGTFGANLLQIALQDELSYQELNQFKANLSRQFRDIKSVRERFFSPSQTVFEVDFKGGTGDLVRQIKGLDQGQFPYRVESTEAKRIVLKPLATRN